MPHILADILTLKQPIFFLSTQLHAYRPSHCLHCVCKGLWRHGYYFRKNQRSTGVNQQKSRIKIPRFFCPQCRRTCSCLPQVLPPLRWYLWAAQQQVLMLLIRGLTVAQVSRQTGICRQTIRRWWKALNARFSLHAATLRSRFPSLGLACSFDTFWRVCLRKMSLARAMYFLHLDGVDIP